MNTKLQFLSLIFTLIMITANSQSNRDEINGDWAAQNVSLTNTPEADIMVRVGDIDNLGFGWPGGFDPFSGASTPQHAFPFSPGAEDVDGTDRIMVITSYAGSPPSGQDGYTNTTSRPENLPRPITMNYNLGGITIGSAVLQIFVDDFQAPVWKANYTVTINGVQAPYMAQQINTLAQTGPIGKLITIAIPPSQFNLVNSGSLSILIDDLTTGAGDGFAIDFVKLLVNPVSFTYTGTISGTVTNSANGNPIPGALVSASGYVETTTNSEGAYTLQNVPAGLISVSASAAGFLTKSGFVDLLSGQTATFNLQLDAAIIPECDTLHYPLPGTATLFTVLAPESGYVCGNNTYGDLAKADYFEPAESGKYLYKGFFEFAYISKQSGQNPNVEFKVWDNSGNSGYPGGILGTATLPLTSIFDDVVASRMTVVNFDPPVLINGPFYLGVVLPTTTGDTLALISTDEGEVDPGTAFEQWFDGSWHAFSESNSWNLKLTQGIYALYCDVGFGITDDEPVSSLKVYPNPVADILTVEFDAGTRNERLQVTLVNFLGQQEQSFTLAPGTEQFTISMEGLSKGIYILNVSGNHVKISRKIIKK
jgi:hypothetical protein